MTAETILMALIRRTAAVTGSAVALIGLASGYAAWAQPPDRLVVETARPPAMWTRTADAPPGVQVRTNPKSLLWRMPNGELDGYQAKLVVIQLPYGRSISDPFAPNREAEFLAGWGAVIAEIRARQPQAKVLLQAPMPRGIAPLDRRESWREVRDSSAAVIARLTDDETVFYADFGDRYFLAEGSYNHDYWHGAAGTGAQPAAFDIWAEALEPWIDRFVR